jgi:hypothetical protein
MIGKVMTSAQTYREIGTAAQEYGDVVEMVLTYWDEKQKGRLSN